jgi:hypothetical protein
MTNFGIPRRGSQSQREEPTPPNWRRGLYRVWLLVSVGWIMGWTIYLILEGVQGGISTRADFIVVPILLFAPPIALWIFGLAAGWALRGFEPDP